MPQIAQQDYIKIQITSIESGIGSNIPKDVVRQLYRCARNRTLSDVIFFTVGYCESRVIYWSLVGTELNVAFYSVADGGVSTLTWDAEPDPDDE